MILEAAEFSTLELGVFLWRFCFNGQVHANPWNCSAHVWYMSALKKWGKVKKLQFAREAMRKMLALANRIKKLIRDFNTTRDD